VAWQALPEDVKYKLLSIELLDSHAVVRWSSLLDTHGKGWLRRSDTASVCDVVGGQGQTAGAISGDFSHPYPAV